MITPQKLKEIKEKNGLTDRQALFALEIFKKEIGESKKTNTDIVSEIYNLGGKKGKKSKATASSMANENLNKPTIKRAIADIYDVAGLTEELVAVSLVEDIQKKPQNRVRELELASRILGLTEKSTISEKNEKEIFQNQQYELIAERITERIIRKKPIK